MNSSRLGNGSSFNAIGLDPYNDSLKFEVVVAIAFEGFRCVVDYHGVEPDARPARDAAAALATAAQVMHDNLSKVMPTIYYRQTVMDYIGYGNEATIA